METQRTLAAQFAEDPINTLLGMAFVALLVFWFVRRHKKKEAARGKQSSIVVETISSVPSVARRSTDRWYGDYEKLISIAKFQKVVYKRFVVFDLETTGLDSSSDRIIEIGAVRVENGKITEKYQQLVNPKIHIPEEASEKHHITDSMVAHSPTIDQALPDFLSFAGNDVLAAHNGGFDASFLDEACRKYHRKEPVDYFDTMRLSVYWPNLQNRKLETFLKAAGIKNKDAHRALGDAEATAELIIKSFEMIQRKK